MQQNHSRSRRGVVRGMHLQVGDGIGKLVRCARGAILDVVVDVRRGSPSFGEWEAFELSDENHHQVWCPVGFAHGFCVVSEVADVIYAQSGYYAPDMAPLWNDLRGHATIVLAGHEHDMQRFKPIDGITEFVSGAGGDGHYSLKRTGRLAFGNARDYGALRLALRPGAATYAFVTTGGRVLDSGTLRCRR